MLITCLSNNCELLSQLVLLFPLYFPTESLTWMAVSHPLPTSVSRLWSAVWTHLRCQWRPCLALLWAAVSRLYLKTMGTNMACLLLKSWVRHLWFTYYLLHFYFTFLCKTKSRPTILTCTGFNYFSWRWYSTLFKTGQNNRYETRFTAKQMKNKAQINAKKGWEKVLNA